VDAGAISPHHGHQGRKAKGALGGVSRGGRTGPREPRLAGAVAVRTRLDSPRESQTPVEA
jgi:hypothetical protein